MEAITQAGLTLHLEKCQFGKQQIKSWGTIISGEGVYPNPEKVDALNFIDAPKSKPELISLLCMLPSNAEFIENFAMKMHLLLVRSFLGPFLCNDLINIVFHYSGIHTVD